MGHQAVSGRLLTLRTSLSGENSALGLLVEDAQGTGSWARTSAANKRFTR
jgi:hypothetical protein